MAKGENPRPKHDEHRICALCRHLEVMESGREFPLIADTEFIVFRCRVFRWTTREDYLMDSEPARSFAKQEPFHCPRWESWDSPAQGDESVDRQSAL